MDFGGTYYPGESDFVPVCPNCFGNSKCMLVDFWSTDAAPWIIPVFACEGCRYIFSKRTKTMESLANGYSSSEKRAYLKENLPVIPRVDQPKSSARKRMEKSQEIDELNENIQNFKLK